jgi:hypothetical protein
MNNKKLTINPAFVKKFIEKLTGKEKEEKEYKETIKVSKEELIDPSSNCLEKVLNDCKINQNSWDVNSFNTKQTVGGDYLWTVYFKKGKGIEDIKGVIKDIVKVAPVSPKEYKIKDNGLLAEINLADVHCAKLAWMLETDNDYDIKIAVKVFRDAIDYKISQLQKYSIKRILFPIGNDFYHIDNLDGMTTAGTRQDVDSRYAKMFREGSKLILETINKLQNIAPVDVVVVCGNHARISEFLLGEVVDAYYHNNPNVTIDNSPQSRKYYRWGNNLIGFAHGDDIKLVDLPLIMASERAKDWGQTKNHFIKCGHFHHQKMILNEVSGCIVEIVPSLSGTDGWHKKKGYVNNLRSAITSLYDKEDGLVTKFYYNL